VAVAYHTREHGFSDRPEYVLLQGRASLSPVEDRGWVANHAENWERFSGPHDDGWIGERWLRAYYWRVGVTIAVERVTVWPDLACRGQSTVHGSPVPDSPAEPQSPPAKGAGPRVDHHRAARRARRLPNVLLGWVGADGFPVVVPVIVAGTDELGIVLEVPSGVELPLGGRRAGMTAHSFTRYTWGQRQRIHTGWLEAVPGEQRVIYAPHTQTGYWLPKSRLLFRIGSGFVTRRGLRRARRAGFVES
jgi:hypothetical protein